MSIDLGALPAGFGPMLIFCIGIYFLTRGVRTVLEIIHPKICTWPSWGKLLRTLPVLLGGVFGALMYKYPFLDTLPTWGTRFVYGAFSGGVASFAYLVFKAAVQKFFGVTVAAQLGDSNIPPPMPPEVK